MKTRLLFILALVCSSLAAQSQTLTLVTGKKLYEHHSSSLSNKFYGYSNRNGQSGYDFVKHVNVPSASVGMEGSRDMVEHNGPYGWNGVKSGWHFGFTSAKTNIGNFNYMGNDQTLFYLDNTLNFANLNTVSDLVTAYNAAQAKKFDTAVVTGNIYIAKVRNTNMYLAMRITTVSNLSAAQMNALDNNQPITADVFFEFEYKYGSICTLPTVSLSSSNPTICAGEEVILTASGATTYNWSNGATGPTIQVSPSSSTTYTVLGTTTDATCTAGASLVQDVSECTGIQGNALQELSLFPNPFSNAIHVNEVNGSLLKIESLTGTTVEEITLQPGSKNIVVNTEAYPEGIYIITLRNQEGVTQRKKLVKH